MADARRLYLDLLKRAVLNELGLENELRIAYLRECVARAEAPDDQLLRDIRWRRAGAFEELRRRRLEGRSPLETAYVEYAHTMVGRARLDQLEACLDRIVADRVPGDLLEAGVWRGGASLFMRGYLAASGVTDRAVWLADSFRGLPPSTHPADRVDFSTAAALAIDQRTVRDAFERYGLLDDSVRFLEGWFKDTLPRAPIERLALLRLDGDLFESTLDALVALYPKLSPGGFVVIDDYGCLPPCRAAVEAYRLRHRIDEPIERIDWTAVFWRKARKTA